MSERGAPDAFDGSYSPRHIRFFLAHWQSLVGIAEYPSGGRGELDALRREWELIQTTSSVSGVCLCERREFFRATPEEYTRAGGYRPAGADAIAVLLADLELAADALPIHWRSTEVIFAAQLRADVWAARLATHRLLGLPRPQDRGIEPHDSDRRALGLLAQALGWRSGRVGVA